MLVSESRPRSLKWFHAGPLLYGDWGTSRLYVLGLAFFFTAHASVIYLAAIGALMVAVAWAYAIVCRSFPDGGGVYTAARRLSPTLAVVGSTLLLSGYIMTAAISVVEAFHYFGVPESLTGPLSVVTLALVGMVNWLGAKSAGRFALLIAFAALGVSGLLLIGCLPFFVTGVRTISFDYFRQVPLSEAWVSFTSICLALAGVEAVANMTGLMKAPVGKTAKRTIWPVTIEVVALNMVFGLALTGLNYTVQGTSLADLHEPHAKIAERGELDEAGAERAERYTNASMKVIAEQAGDWWADLFTGDNGGGSGESGVGHGGAHGHADGPDEAVSGFGFAMGKVAGITFGLLLLSATNTAVMAMVSVLFAMAQDGELPKPLTKLNFSGVPWIGLLVSIAIPAAVVAVERDVTVLAKLYVLGVCGAITVCIGSTALNKDLEISRTGRIGMYALAAFLGAVTLTIALTQWVSTAFSGGLVAVALGSRWVLATAKKSAPPPIPEPITGWLAEVKAQEGQLKVDPSKPKIMLAARGRHQAEFAVDLARKRKATLFTIFVRPIRLMDVRPGQLPKIEEDRDAQEALGSTGLLAKANGVPFVPIYVTSPDIADEILDYTVTFGCETLIMGKSRRSVFSRKFEGDVVTMVADNLPDEVALITRSADTPHASKLKMPVGAEPSQNGSGGADEADRPAE